MSPHKTKHGTNESYHEYNDGGNWLKTPDLVGSKW